MSELLVRDRTTGAGWQICSKLNRIKHCYETRTRPHSPDASTRLRQAAPVTFGQGKTTQNSQGVQSRRLNRAERRSCGGMNSVLGHRRSSTVTVQSFANVDVCVGAIVAALNTAELGVRVGLVFFFLTSESRSLQQGKTLTRSLSPGKIPIGIRSLSFHNVF